MGSLFGYSTKQRSWNGIDTYSDDTFYYLPNRYHNYSKEKTELLYLPSDYMLNLPPPPTKWEIFMRDMEWWARDLAWKASVDWKYNRALIIGFLMLIFIPDIWSLFRKTRLTVPAT